jgi:hypothetical protein
MSTVALSGSDVVNINNRVFADVADGDFANLTYPNEIANVKTGKNGNSIYSFNATGKQCDFVIRVIRGSSDDKFLNNLLSLQDNNFAGTVLLVGEFIKKIGDGEGNVASDTYILSGGIFVKRVEAKSNAEGDTEQSVAIYTMRFANAPRAIT